jgi:hypothetical protein
MLVEAGEKSTLAEEPSAKKAFSDLLVRVRLEGLGPRG